METLVAAHRMMPFNTWLEVTNLQNGKSVKVRVIDRGPFVGGRIIDLSKAAAREIEMLGPGVAPVKLQVISAPPEVSGNDFFAVQAGAFAVYENAERARARYAQRFGSAQLAMKQAPKPLYRVLVGRERSLQAAQKLADQLRLEVLQVFIVRLDETVPAAPAASTGNAPNP
jgi:rare lipoprotein A